MADREEHSPGALAGASGGEQRSLEPVGDYRDSASILDRLSRFYNPEDHYGEVKPCVDLTSFVANAKIGDGLQTILGPVEASREVEVSRLTLNSLHRMHSEADVTFIKGHFGRILAIATADFLFELCGDGRG